MMDKKCINTAQCERTAEEYYEFRKKGGTANDLVEVPAMRSLLGEIQGKIVIDCGCGFGCHSIYCAKQGAIVTGIDISARMIELAIQKAKQADANVDFKIQDMTDMGDIADNAFDLAISSVAICFGMQSFFKEVHRILRP